jgi:hypothetical protein
VKLRPYPQTHRYESDFIIRWPAQLHGLVFGMRQAFIGEMFRPSFTTPARCNEVDGMRNCSRAECWEEFIARTMTTCSRSDSPLDQRSCITSVSAGLSELDPLFTSLALFLAYILAICLARSSRVVGGSG